MIFLCFSMRSLPVSFSWGRSRSAQSHPKLPSLLQPKVLRAKLPSPLLNLLPKWQKPARLMKKCQVETYWLFYWPIKQYGCERESIVHHSPFCLVRISWFIFYNGDSESSSGCNSYPSVIWIRLYYCVIISVVRVCVHSRKVLIGFWGELQVCVHVEFLFGRKSTGFIKVLHRNTTILFTWQQHSKNISPMTAIWLVSRKGVTLRTAAPFWKVHLKHYVDARPVS